MEVKIEDLKQMLVENCLLKVNIDQIDEKTPLFGPDSVGLDSLDALQITVAIEKKYKVAIADPETARAAMESLGALRDWLERQMKKN